jgi:predicted transposase/invertase (TIGR01784 family)
VNNIELMDPKYDFIFKRIFGHDEEIFISFVNSILNYPEAKKITSATFINNELNKDSDNDKDSRLDVHAILNDSSHVNIEIQMQNTGEYDKRSLYYWSKLYEEQLKKGDNYKNLKPAICINVLNFNLFQNINRFHTILGIVDLSTNIRLLEDFEIHFIELPKVPKKYYNTFEKWMRFLINPSKEEIIAMGDKVIFKALETLEYLSHDPANRAKYEAKRKFYLDYNTGLRTALEEGEVIGIKKGEVIGIKKGEVIGIKKGFEKGEKNKAIKIAKSLRSRNMPLNDVMQITGLSIEEMEEL